MFLIGWRWLRATDENTNLVRKVVFMRAVVGVMTGDWLCVGEIDLINKYIMDNGSQSREKRCDVGLKSEELVSLRFQYSVRPLFSHLEQF